MVSPAAAESTNSDPRDFLMIKLYEAALKRVEALESQPFRSAMSPAHSSSNSQPNASMAMSGEAYGCKLWLDIRPATNNTSNVVVTLHNTVPWMANKLWSKTALMATHAWTLETNLTGATGQDWTATTVPMSGRSNLFFTATIDGGFNTNRSFAGLQFTNSNIGNPDSMGAVGPDHFLEILNASPTNAAVAAFDKCTGQIIQQVPKRHFFAVQHNGTNYPLSDTVDSRVLYDPLARRWLATALDLGSENVMLAVSRSANPLDLTNNWDKYLLPFARPGVGTDFPTLGLDAAGIYISTSTRPFSSGGYGGNLMLVLDKAALYQQTVVSNFIDISTNELPAHVIQPAMNFDVNPRGGLAWFVAKKDRDPGTNYQGGAICYRRLNWSVTNGSWTVNWAETNWADVPNSPAYRDYFDLDEGNISAPQFTTAESGGARIELFHTGSRVMTAVIRNGALWTCQHVGFSGTNGTYPGDDSGTNVSHSGIQWLKIITDTNGAFLAMTNGRIFDPTNSNPRWYYLPSLMVNAAGDVVFGFSGANTNGYVSAFYGWRGVTDVESPAPRLLHAGDGVFTTGQFGDYSATSLDPTDAITFWTVQGYARDFDNDEVWGTWISEIVPSFTAP
jgi:hypothetical protein